jgi:hypothetical protein
MFTNRFLLVIGILSLLLVSLAAASPLTNDPVDTSWPPRPDYSHLNEKPMVSVPNIDFYQRHPEWTWVSRDAASDLTDYFFRQELLPAGVSIDLTDYFFRHL